MRPVTRVDVGCGWDRGTFELVWSLSRIEGRLGGAGGCSGAHRAWYRRTTF